MPELTEHAIADLIDHARRASAQAYCPYSKFPVGAAVLTEDGRIFTGCNVENASFGLTLCAERNAIFNMVTHSGRKIAAIAIYTPTPEPSSACGACRQVINEFGPDALVVIACDGTSVLRKKLSELLPGAFGPANL